ncbi:MAG: DUF429 domain-containing protein [Salaquimonas sp.]|nr:DUF429 domain-containing protein [Salaquimonas sp.]
MTRTLAGVDGCRGGWIAVHGHAGKQPEINVFASFGELLGVLPGDAIIAVDMPIGLPERTGHGGRGPEQTVRPLLGRRQSSVFSIPSRSAVYAHDYRSACEAALASSDPPRKVSKQAFNLFPKIMEIDALMTRELEKRVYEVHPELAFWRLNGEQAMRLPKKIKGRVNPAGMAERKALLASLGFLEAVLGARLPRGAAADDLLDACACHMIAQRLAGGTAKPFPDPPLRTESGTRMAIWA